MKRFCCVLLIFIPFCILIYWILLIFLVDGLNIKLRKVNYRLGAYGHLHSRIREIPKFKNVDILFLGASNAYRGLDTRIFEQNGWKAFNLGSSSQTPLQTYILLDRYLDEINPKIIIYAKPEFDDPGIESSVDLLSNDQLHLNDLTLICATKHSITFNTGLYSIYRRIFNLDAAYQENLKKGLDQYVSGGFVEKEIQCYSPSQDLNYSDKTSPPLSFQLDYFRMIVERLKERQIKILLINPPVTKNYYLADPKIDSFMDSVAEYINYNELLILNDSLDFYDGNHLNQRGVLKFNQALIDDIKKKNW